MAATVKKGEPLLKKFYGLIGVISILTIGYWVVVMPLHNAQPRMMTNEIITRNSLLEHRFAGICMNCHMIQEIGPVPINRENMPMLPLDRKERMLVMAGQRVDVPTMLDALRTPALIRDDLLPHTFVGVCSNCHPILDIGPSREFMNRGMLMANQELRDMQGMLTAEEISRGTAPKLDEESVWLRNFWGFGALGMFLVSAIYITMRVLIRTSKKKFGKMFNMKFWFSIHAWSSVLAFIAVFLHWWYSYRGNTLLHLSLALVAWLTIAGFTLRQRLVKGKIRKNVALLHTQQLIFVFLIVLVVVGHIVIGVN